MVTNGDWGGLEFWLKTLQFSTPDLQILYISTYNANSLNVPHRDYSLVYFVLEYSPYTHAKQYTGSTLIFSSAAQPLGILLSKMRNCYLTSVKNSKDDTSIFSLYSRVMSYLQYRAEREQSLIHNSTLESRSIICTLLYCTLSQFLQFTDQCSIYFHTQLYGLPPSFSYYDFQNELNLNIS